MTSRIRRVVLSLAAMCVPSLAFAYTITMSSPQEGTTWTVGANMTVHGQITWRVDTRDMNKAIMEPRPDTCIVYIHAGGASGTVTNSANAAINVVTTPDGQNVTVGTETYTATLELRAANPPIGGGNGGPATYFVEAVPYALGQPILLNGVALNVLRQITVQGG
jgi:hypothetical protein